jgi:hypothetical protein
MSAHSASHRGGWLSALVAQVSDYVFEEIEETVAPQPAPPLPQPVFAVVAAAPRAGASTVARLLAAEMAVRSDGSAIVFGPHPRRRAAPPSRAAIRLATGLTGIADAQPRGRLCVVGTDPRADARDPARCDSGWAELIQAARYLAPVVLDLPADGSAAGVAEIADRVVVIAPGSGEPALLDAVASVVGGDSVKLVNRVAEPGAWSGRADVLLSDSRLGARAAALGTRALGSLGSEIAGLADRLGIAR